MRQQVLGVIPARYESSRFPGKPLANLWGRPLLQHTWERASQAEYLTEIIIATDDRRIVDLAERIGAEWILTNSSHQSGTDRVHEVAQRKPEYSHILNIQGDEPTIDPALLDRCAEVLLENKCDIVTAATPIESEADYRNPNVVKVVPGPGKAWYFSRSPIPAIRDEAGFGSIVAREHQLWWHHVGLYGYTREALSWFVEHGPTPLERTEGLEQLRALELGMHIEVVPWEYHAPGVDTPDQLIDLEKLGPPDDDG